MEKQWAMDLMWYLWCGSKSPVFGKDKMTTFEHYFIADKKRPTRRPLNPYYKLSVQEEFCDRILEEFDLPGKGLLYHQRPCAGEDEGWGDPVKAGGKLFIIDGGLSKAYQATTGIAGYTLIYNSNHLALAEHMPFDPNKESSPRVSVVGEDAEPGDGGGYRQGQRAGGADRGFVRTGGGLPGRHAERKGRINDQDGIFADSPGGAGRGRVPYSVIQENLNYYNSYIDGETAKGRPELQVIEELGGPRIIARTIVDATLDTEDRPDGFQSYGEGKSTTEPQKRTAQKQYTGYGTAKSARCTMWISANGMCGFWPVWPVLW